MAEADVTMDTAGEMEEGDMTVDTLDRESVEADERELRQKAEMVAALVVCNYPEQVVKELKRQHPDLLAGEGCDRPEVERLREEVTALRETLWGVTDSAAWARKRWLEA